MKELEQAIDGVWAEFEQVPELETVEGREVYDKNGRLVAIFDDSRHALALVELLLALPELIDRAEQVTEAMGAAQALIDEQNEKLAKPPA